MLCAGTEALTRVCLVHDLFYDTKERVFTYYGTGIVNDRGAEPVRANASAFNAATCVFRQPLFDVCGLFSQMQCPHCMARHVSGDMQVS